MYFDDLSEYRYYLQEPLKNVLNVGWLDSLHAFSIGASPVAFVDKLQLVMSPKATANVHVNPIRSSHPCNLCEKVEFEQDPRLSTLQVGSTEIWIPASDCSFYAAPSMIIHYVTDHYYLPPEAFIRAVMDFDVTKTFDAQSEYTAALASRVESRKT